MRATIKDVARTAGVSTATVSNVLTQKKYVSEEITLKVKTAMRDLGYQPNTIARSLKVKRTFRIGVTVPDITNPFFGEIVESAERVANDYGFQITLCTSENNAVKEGKILDTFLSTGVDGIINVAPILSDTKLNKTISVPMVIVDRPHFNTRKNLAFVYADNYNASAGVARHFIQNGYKKFICFAGQVDKIPNAKRRLEGFMDELLKNGFSEEDCQVFYSDFTFESGYQTMMDFLEKHPLDIKYAAYISSDIMAWGAMEALKTKGYKLPRDMGIIGYDNIYFSKFLYPGLTTVENPTKDLGSFSMNLIMDSIMGQQELAGKYIVLSSALILRQSD